MSSAMNTLERMWHEMLHEADQAPTVDADGRTWFDVRPLVDPRERSAHQVDIANEALELGTCTGLLARHPLHPHLVRITTRDSFTPPINNTLVH